MKSAKMLKTLALLTSILLLGACASNGSKGASAGGDSVQGVVIQVSSKDPVVQKIALNVAVNVQKAYGIDNVDVEIVAFGPGLSILTKKSKNVKRVESLALQNITFSACGNTMKKVTKKKGKTPKLAEGVKIVPAGAIRIMELHKQGYTYIRP